MLTVPDGLVCWFHGPVTSRGTGTAGRPGNTTRTVPCVFQADFDSVLGSGLPIGGYHGEPQTCGLTSCYLGNREDSICLDFLFLERNEGLQRTRLCSEGRACFFVPLGNLTVGRVSTFGLVWGFSSLSQYPLRGMRNILMSSAHVLIEDVFPFGFDHLEMYFRRD